MKDILYLQEFAEYSGEFFVTLVMLLAIAAHINKWWKTTPVLWALAIVLLFSGLRPQSMFFSLMTTGTLLFAVSLRFSNGKTKWVQYIAYAGMLLGIAIAIAPILLFL